MDGRGGNDPINSPAPDEILAFLRKAGNRARRVAGFCTGAFVLAEAGLLAQRSAAPH
ncbi:hypothetical protein CS8_051580 [Cupriavidus sp. 8B]